jgi:diguanylate cyclase (GGDEF)-like protein
MNDESATPVILAVDDDPSNINVIAGHLASLKPELLVANSGELALDILTHQSPDIILLDINMPGLSGLEVCAQLKASDEYKNIPIIFLTASQNDISEGFAVGGVDYILKPVKAEELIARVTTHIRLNNVLQSLDKANVMLEGVNVSLEQKVQRRTRELVAANTNLRREVEERRRLQDKLSYLANYDFITRMLNRASMEEEIRLKLEHVGLTNERWYLIYFDIDQFKIVNDTCGHIAGDELLRQIAELMRDIYSEDYICARMGGDEFTILLKADNLDEADRKAHYIKQVLEGHKFDWIGEIYRHSISLALVELDESVDSVSHILSIAERTCFESKRKGGGEISVYNHSRDYIDKAQQQMKVIPIIHQAIEHDQFILYFQHIKPLYVAQHRETQGDEASVAQMTKLEILLRLQDKNGKVKPPGHFIPVAERFHIITEIDKWVLKNTFKMMQDMPDDIMVSINLSGEFIVKSNAAQIIQDLLMQYRVKPKCVCLEITETSAILNLEATQMLISKLRKLGCLFALDDFGTGTASYEYLKLLAIDFVKIDGIFVRDIENDDINRKMVESIVGIAEAKNVKVIAECVETAEALQMLSGMHIDFYQGFYSHKPEPLSNLLTPA